MFPLRTAAACALGCAWLLAPLTTVAQNEPDAAFDTFDGSAAPEFVSSEVVELSAPVACPQCQSAAAPCNCPACQAAAAAKKQADLQKAVAAAYAPVFYNNNFSYLNNPLYDDWYYGEHFKQVPIGPCDGLMLDVGGQYRARFHNEHNMRGLGLTGRDDEFLLQRARIFMNGKFGDCLRVYAEYIDASEEWNDYPPRQIEVNRSDMLNLFADARIFDGCCGDLTFRVGRQELLYGSQRLISPLDWANTRRTFEGAKFLWVGEDWNIDVFATRPVIVNPTHFDSPDENQEFFGAWGTYKAVKDQTYDLYAVQYNNGSAPNDFRFTTLGGRWLGANGNWLWEFEGGAQFGQNTDGSDHGAGFVTGGIGHQWDHCWKPTLWGYYDWANGTDDLGAGNGFNHLFPLAHKYLGFMDLFGRSNIESPNVLFTVQPHQKVTFLLWYYYLFLQNGNDTPYNVNMTPFNPGFAPASRELGHEIDVLVTYSINARMEMVFGYSHFFAGQYYKQTQFTPSDPPNFSRNDGDFFYSHFQWNF